MPEECGLGLFLKNARPFHKLSKTGLVQDIRRDALPDLKKRSKTTT